jgi:anti-anti-sigma regulatory factor
MPIRITKIDDPEGDETVLKVEGSLYLEDAQLLEEVCRDLGSQMKRSVRLDLAGLSFIDSESASVLTRLKRDHGVRLEMRQLFIGKVIELAEAPERGEEVKNDAISPRVCD